MKKITLRSPAKVNLYLKMVGRRQDGYHKLDSLFHRISLSDTLILSKQDECFSFSSNAKLPVYDGNIIYKAYLVLKEHFPKLKGVKVKLTKRIPIGAGLGGGSSNAAFFLLGMIKLYGLKISQAKLMKLGLEIGADVPFFLLNKRQARAQGIGEKLKVTPCRSKKWFLLISDPKPLSTPEVYQYFKKKKFPFSKSSWPKRELVNDLQQPAIQIRPSIKKTIQKLESLGAEAVLMSGSGPTVFACSASKMNIQRLKSHLPTNLRKRAHLCSTA